MTTVLTLPQEPGSSLSIRAKALLFHDPRSLTLLRHVERVAASDATALIIGETGTGKELLARHIHKVSRRHGPFVAVNCGAFSESLIDAELFGHEAGAYTGAAKARAGWFEAADHGTLFLDEIGDLPPALQVKLLRVLQERQVVRLGSTRTITLDVRLIAATNVNLAEAVSAQHFRADLFYRLSVATVALPPLRDRPGDILPLVEHFSGIFGSRLGLRQVQFSPQARDALLSYPWPGNIRELENTVHHALIVSREGAVQVQDLHLPSQWTQHLALSRAAEHPQAAAQSATPSDPLIGDALPGLRRELNDMLTRQESDVFERVQETLVRSAFDHCGGNQVQTARALGLTRNSVRTLLKRYGLLVDARSDTAEPFANPEDDAHAQEVAGDGVQGLAA